MASLGLRLVLPLLGAANFAIVAKAAELAFDIRVDKGRVPDNLRLIRVKQGDVVKLRWHVDRPMVLHLHGYDIEKTVQPDAVVEMSFTARATGRFPLHAHASSPSKAADDEATLLYVEVYPR
jgi:hypothetical protein